ncbi:MAG: hypothetical protein OEZ31_07875 [Nitrospirota bacterium]|nr:hypothetical protein [Nitrospirota bacterium]MDH5768856.1 hypothetical protein [Nitrospirota bacterium]
MFDLIGKIVEVQTADMMYVGKLIEIGEVDVHLESESGWVIVPVERIMSIKKKD